MIKIALYGKPGAGKSTLAELLNREFSAMGKPVMTLKLAAPLYTLQAVIHAFAGRPMTDANQQDGLLLNDLAAHLRRINPAALTEPFARRLAQATALHPEGVAVCDDMRAADIEALLDMGFTFVEVSAPEELRRARKAARNDLSLGSDDHPTEATPACEPHYRVVNDGDVHLLRSRAAELAREVLR